MSKEDESPSVRLAQQVKAKKAAHIEDLVRQLNDGKSTLSDSEKTKIIQQIEWDSGGLKKASLEKDTYTLKDGVNAVKKSSAPKALGKETGESKSISKPIDSDDKEEHTKILANIIKGFYDYKYPDSTKGFREQQKNKSTFIENAEHFSDQIAQLQEKYGSSVDVLMDQAKQEVFSNSEKYNGKSNALVPTFEGLRQVVNETKELSAIRKGMEKFKDGMKAVANNLSPFKSKNKDLDKLDRSMGL